MATAIFPSTLLIQVRLNRTQSLSLASTFRPTTSATILSTSTPNRTARDMVVRMGGGPRTYPGGVSKWQWKRMQQKKATQLLKARLLRERQIYEMRKRTELKSAMSQLEKPWEAVQKAPNLFSVDADEQVKTLADRFQKPGGFDMWNERDGPEIFNKPTEGFPSVRFFPKGAVHSIKPYAKVGEQASVQEQGEQLRFDDWIAKGAGGIRKTGSWRNKKTVDVEHTQRVRQNVSEKSYNIDQRRNGLKRRNGLNGKNLIDAETTNGARENASKKFSTQGGNSGMVNRRVARVWHTLDSFGEKKGDVKCAEGVYQNASKNEMRQLKPVERQREVKVKGHGRLQWHRKFREVTNT